MENKNPRRIFFIQAAQAVAMTMVGGLVWSAFLKESKANPLILRPPGALEEKEFLKHCVKCGLCVEACPFYALYIENDSVYCHEEKCLDCHECIDECMFGAITEL